MPVVWNTGGYDKVETLRRLKGKIDIYLPDLKYLTPETARRYSHAADYPAAAVAAIREMVDQVGPCRFDEDDFMTRGVIIRHLVLPGQVNEAKRVMDWVAESFPAGTVLFSLMSQYTPWGKACGDRELGRKLRISEMRAVQAYMENLGLSGFCQEAQQRGAGLYAGV